MYVFLSQELWQDMPGVGQCLAKAKPKNKEKNNEILCAIFPRSG